MPKGGARNRSGPPRDLTSGRTERLKVELTALPAAGSGITHIPAFPLPRTRRYAVEFDENGKPYRVLDERETRRFRDREVSLWHSLWGLPQGVAWEREPWRWVTLADYCRAQTVFEFDPDKSAAFLGQIVRLKDDLGLTTAGMRLLGWQVKHDEVSTRRPVGPRVAPVVDDEDDERDRLSS